MHSFELSQPASGEAGSSDGALGLYYVITGAMFGTSVEILGASCKTVSCEALPSF